MKLKAVVVAPPLAAQILLQTVNNTSQEVHVRQGIHNVINLQPRHDFFAGDGNHTSQELHTIGQEWRHNVSRPAQPRHALRLRQDPAVGQTTRPPTHHSAHGAFGMGPVMYTFVLGILSGISLPVGAYMGVRFSPVGDEFVGAIMAFGAGALLFAVTVELYGHSLNELARGVLGYYEMYTTIICALLGALFYLYINRWLERTLGGHDNDKRVPELGNHLPTNTGTPSPQPSPLTTPRRSPTGFPTGSPRLVERVSNTTAEALRARKRWGKIRKLVRNWTIVRHWSLVSKLRGHHRTGIEDALLIAATHDMKLDRHDGSVDEKDKQKAKKVALALFLGLLVDGVPEGVLMGFLAAEGHLTPVLVISLFVANFPEAFSSASLLKVAGMPVRRIIGIWAALCLLIGSLGALSCALLLHFYPSYGPGVDLPIGVLLGIAGVEGITGGAMICCVSSVMLPEAFERAGKAKRLYLTSGFLCTAGFLTAVAIKTTGG